MELYGRDKVKLSGNTLNILLNFKSLYCNAFYEIKNSIYVHMGGDNRHYSMHTSLFLYVGNFILFCKLCHYIMQIVI